MQNDISAVVTSFNRSELLRQSLTILERIESVSEIIVCDDGSTDGSPEMVAEEFPNVTVLKNETGHPRGVVLQKHLGYLAASQPFILSIDEDLILQSDGTVAWLRTFFDAPETAIVAVPFVDILRDELVQNASPDLARPAHRHAHIGAGVMVRRQAYLDVGGYSVWLEGYREEAELGLRMMAKSLHVLVPPPVFVAHHMRSPGDLSPTARYRSARNDMLFYWRYTPGWRWVGFVLASVLRNLRDGLRENDIRPRLRGLIAALPHARAEKLSRLPVKKAAFQRFRTLKSKGPILCELQE